MTNIVFSMASRPRSTHNKRFRGPEKWLKTHVLLCSSLRASKRLSQSEAGSSLAAAQQCTGRPVSRSPRYLGVRSHPETQSSGLSLAELSNTVLFAVMCNRVSSTFLRLLLILMCDHALLPLRRPRLVTQMTGESLC